MYESRTHAGRVLAERLAGYHGRGDLLVLGLPRGGVPVALEVALALDAPLDVFVVRKLGVPTHPELAMGAIASGGVRVVSDDVVSMLHIPPDVIEDVAAREAVELRRREALYRGDGHMPEIRDRVVILVDDGLATGATMRAAARAVRAMAPRELVVAVPVGAPETCEALTYEADEVVCAATPPNFQAVGLWYREFGQTSDEEVRACLERGRRAGRQTTPERGDHER